MIGLDILDNVIPYIPKEEEKVEVETKKILGRFAQGAIAPHPVKVSCTCTRVAVLEGHTESVFVVAGSARPRRRRSPRRHARVEGRRGSRELPVVAAAVDRGARRSRSALSPGSTATPTAAWPPAWAGIREDAVLENGVKYVLVSHNTKMGAAKGAVLVAELLRAQGSDRLTAACRVTDATGALALRASKPRKERFAAMAYVVAEPCIKCKYTDCVEVCPVNCFYEGANILVIHPDECIDCGACEPVCPTKAIFPESDLPEKWAEYKELNADFATKWPNIAEKKDAAPRGRGVQGQGGQAPDVRPESGVLSSRVVRYKRRMRTHLRCARCGASSLQRRGEATRRSAS